MANCEMLFNKVQTTKIETLDLISNRITTVFRKRQERLREFLTQLRSAIGLILPLQRK